MTEVNDREQWLEERRGCVGASDVPAILGESPFAGPMQVWASKVLGYTTEDKERLIYGRYMERAVSKMYRWKTKRETFDYTKTATTIQYHRDIPWLGATLDDITRGSEEHPAPENYQGTAPLEIKTSSGWVYQNGKWSKVNKHQWADDPPLYNQIQLQMQIACIDSMWGSLTALFPENELTWSDQLRNDRFLKAAYPHLEQFWKLVQSKEPPPVDALPSSLDIAKQIYKDDTGDIVTLTAEHEQLVKDWLALGEALSESKKLEKRRKHLEAQIRFVLKDATFAEVPSLGKYLTLKKTTRKGYVVEPTEFRTLRIANNI
jgi:putative phage-type endonuclease